MGEAVRLERLIAAPRERVFRAWTDPGTMGRWLSPVGHAEVSADLRVGGSFQVAMIDGDVRIEHRGEYLEVDPPARLRFTWSSPYTGPGPTVVTVDLAEVDGGTRLVLVHEDLPAEQVAPHAGGWSKIVDRLASEVLG